MELIVVIAIIGVLAAIVVPTTLHFVDEAKVQAAEAAAGAQHSVPDKGATVKTDMSCLIGLSKKSAKPE